MRTFRTSLLAGAGAVALAAGVIAPGVASAGSLDFLGSSGSDEDATVVDSGDSVIEGNEGDVTVTADATGQCTVTFSLDVPEGDDSNWVAQYRVDGEDADEDWASEKGAFYTLFHPVVAVHEGDAEILNEKYGDDYGWDVGVGEQTVDLSDVPATEDGTHEVEFWFYRGVPKDGWGANEDSGETVTVTGCPTTDDEEEGADADSSIFDTLFGSLGSLSKD